MPAPCRLMGKRQSRVSRAAFSLIELLISIVILSTVMAGIIFGYAQANRMAEWSSMSLAAQSYALQGLEQVRSAKWDLWANPTIDLIQPQPPGVIGGTISFTQSDIMDIPTKGGVFYVTNYITATQLSLSPQLREVQSSCVWVFPRTKQLFTNTVITYRAPDHQ